jgi:hypothetical protein
MNLSADTLIQVIATGMTGSGKTHSLFGGGDGGYGSHGLVERIVEVRFGVWGMARPCGENRRGEVWGLGYGTAMRRES